MITKALAVMKIVLKQSIIFLNSSVKPKKKYFDTVQEKKLYIEEYTKKKKTELCKNYVMTGKCKYGTDVLFI